MAVRAVRRLLDEPLPCSEAEAGRLLGEAERLLRRSILVSALASEAAVLLSLVLAVASQGATRLAAMMFAALFSLMPLWVYASRAPLREAASRLRRDPGLIQSLCGLSLGEALRHIAMRS